MTNSPLCRDSSGQTVYLSDVDHNPDDVRVEPTLGQRLIPLRADGHIPFGFNEYSVDFGELSEAEQRAAHQRAGSSIHRYDALWGIVEWTRGTYNWTTLDRRYCNAMRAGVVPNIIIQSSPRWAVECAGAQNYCFKPPASEFDGDLQAFAEAVAIRYPGTVIEAWNEPNLSSFWESPDVDRYVEVLRVIYTGVKNGSPDTPVIGGNFTNAGATGRDGDVSWIGRGDFLRGMYAGGAQRLHGRPRFPSLSVGTA